MGSQKNLYKFVTLYSRFKILSITAALFSDFYTSWNMHVSVIVAILGDIRLFLMTSAGNKGISLLKLF